ncbi:MAG: TetR/AcrR family transcriptional repressor of nem operon [Candidatus Azotimanducaceae bacterium]|jgi:TetR/AcrR family transcriptional repressor of nem operon
MPRKSHRRELIIDIATTRFLISGYDIVTVDELCELSVSTKGSFYHFFANKETLAVDVVNSVWHNIETEIEQNFAAPHTARESLGNEIDRISTSFQRFNGKRYFIGCPIGTLGVSLRGKSQKLTRRLNFALTHMRQFYVDAFEDGLRQGEFKNPDNATAGEFADRFQLGLQGLSTLGKVQSNPNKIKALRLELKKIIK